MRRLPARYRSRGALLRKLTVVATIVSTVVAAPTALAAPGVPVTYRGHAYDTAVDKPTADKPQSKLWYHDGSWWALMVESTGTLVFVHQLMPDHSWLNTGTVVDNRLNGTGDALWSPTDGKLYVATRQSGSNLRVTRMSYNSVAELFTVDSGFPVEVNTGGGSESATIDKDSRGRLWVTYTRASRLWVAHSLDATAQTWTEGFQPSGVDTTIARDDISALISFNGNIGVMYSDQTAGAFRFAIHRDSDADNVWTGEVALIGASLADDHINLKQLTGDAQGRVFAAVKTSLGDVAGTPPGETQVGVLVRSAGAPGAGLWSLVPAGTVADDHTRPIIMIDQTNQELYFFAVAPANPGGDVFVKRTSLAAPSFGPGRGEVFVSREFGSVNNPSGPKDPVTAESGVVVLAEGANRYVHAEMQLAGGQSEDTVPPTVPSGLSAGAPPGGPVDLGWTAATDDVGVTGYGIYRNGDLLTTTSGTATTYTDTGVLAGQTYTYAVDAVDAAANRSAQSATASVTVPPAAGGIALRAATTAANTAVNNIVVPLPPTQAGDLLLASIDLRGSATITPPSGWVLVRQDVNGTAMRKATFRRVASAAEPPSYTWTFSAARGAVGSMSSYSGVSTTAPVPASSGQANTTSSKQVGAPSVTTTSPNSVVVGLFGVAREATFTPPSGMTERTDVSSPTSSASNKRVSGETADVLTTAAGATGTRVATSSTAGPSVGQLVVLAPAG